MTFISVLTVKLFQGIYFVEIITQWNLSKPTNQVTREMCQIIQDVRTCLIRHTK